MLRPNSGGIFSRCASTLGYLCTVMMQQKILWRYTTEISKVLSWTQKTKPLYCHTNPSLLMQTLLLHTDPPHRPSTSPHRPSTPTLHFSTPTLHFSTPTLYFSTPTLHFPTDPPLPHTNLSYTLHLIQTRPLYINPSLPHKPFTPPHNPPYSHIAMQTLHISKQCNLRGIIEKLPQCLLRMWHTHTHTVALHQHPLILWPPSNLRPPSKLQSNRTEVAWVSLHAPVW